MFYYNSVIILNISLIFCHIYIICFISYFTLEFYNLQAEAYTINDVSIDIICEFILRSVMLFDINSQIHTLMLLYINSQLYMNDQVFLAWCDTYEFST